MRRLNLTKQMLILQPRLSLKHLFLLFVLISVLLCGSMIMASNIGIDAYSRISLTNEIELRLLYNPEEYIKKV